MFTIAGPLRQRGSARPLDTVVEFAVEHRPHGSDKPERRVVRVTLREWLDGGSDVTAQFRPTTDRADEAPAE